jgi:hypothetical protein
LLPLYLIIFPSSFFPVKQQLTGTSEEEPNLAYDSGSGRTLPTATTVASTKHDPLLTKIKGISIGVIGMNRKMAVGPEEVFWDNLVYTRKEHLGFKIGR